MIATLTGKISSIKPTEIILDVNGVGYQVFIPLTTYKKIKDDSQNVKLFTRLFVRDDSLQLFGFSTQKEIELFNLLITVSGVGPRLGLIILSGLAPNELQQALATGDERTLVGISGIGKKTAQRLIVELKDKMADLAYKTDIAIEPRQEVIISDEALQALVALGFKPASAKDSIIKIQKKYGANLTIEEIIRHALKGE